MSLPFASIRRGPPARQNVLLLGGSGFIGRSVCAALVESSGGAANRITVPTRNLMRARAVQLLPGVQPRDADIHDDATLAALVAGRDAVINLVGTLHGSDDHMQRVHVELPRRLARACRAAGVRRVVHVSALGAGAHAPSRYLRSKAGGEAVWQTSGLDVTVLRPSVVFGDEDRFINLFARLQSMLPVLPLAAADARFQPVWVEDVASAIVRALEDARTIEQTIECVGPDVLTLGDVARIVGRCAGTERPVLALPGWLARIQALLLEWLPGEPLLSRDNLDSMKVATVASGERPTITSLGIAPMALEAIAFEMLGNRSGPARLERWRTVTR